MVKNDLSSDYGECAGTGRIGIADRIDRVARELRLLEKPERHRPSCPRNNFSRRTCNCGVDARNNMIAAYQGELGDCAHLIRESAQ